MSTCNYNSVYVGTTNLFIAIILVHQPQHCEISMSFSALSFVSWPGEDAMYVGGGIPIIASHFNADVDPTISDACQFGSMCSAASTVASAVSSIEASISFPPKSSSASFEFASSLSTSLCQVSDFPLSSRRSCLSLRPSKSNHGSREKSHPYAKFSDSTATKPCERSCDTKLFLSNTSGQHRDFLAAREWEVYSLGPGNPWQTT